MDTKLELVFLPVTDVDRAKKFYETSLGFQVDHDHVISDDLRFVQLTPQGSACSIAIGKGITEKRPGETAIQLVVDNADDIRAELLANGAEVSDVDDQSWGRFVYVTDPDGNSIAYQEIKRWN